MDAQTFGSFLQAQRKRLGLTQSQLAEKLHVTDKAVSRWERGVGLPDIQLLEPLAQALELSLTELIRSERMEADTISRDAADAAVADTLALARAKRRRTLLYWLTAVPVWCVEVFLMGTIFCFVDEPGIRSISVFLIISSGSFAMNAVKSLLDYRFGLVKVAPKRPWTYYLRLLLAFASCIALVLYIPIHMAGGVKIANRIALISTIVYVTVLIFDLRYHIRNMPTDRE